MYTNGTLTLPNFRAVQLQYPNSSLPRNHPENWPEGPWEWVEPAPVEFGVPDVRVQREAIIRSEASVLYQEPVTLPDGSVWNGGFESAVAIASAAELARFSGQALVPLYDFYNDEYLVSMLQAKQIAAAIGADYQVKFAAKQAAMRALADISDVSPDARDQINAVSLSDFLPA